MKESPKFSPEVRERAVRMVLAQRLSEEESVRLLTILESNGIYGRDGNKLQYGLPDWKTGVCSIGGSIKIKPSATKWVAGTAMLRYQRGDWHQ